jgi:hypothetical protein
MRVAALDAPASPAAVWDVSPPRTALRGGPPPTGNQHDLSGGDHETDTATTYHGPPDPPNRRR